MTGRTAPRALTDLPYHRHLVETGELPADSADHEYVHVTGTDLSSVDAPGSRFVECAFSGVAFGSARLSRTNFTDVWLNGCGLIGTDVTATGWLDAEFVTTVLAGTAAYDSTLRRVTFHGCKLTSVNLRGSRLTDVTFVDCALRDVDFGGATLTRVRFPRSTLRDVRFDNTVLDRVDLRETTELRLHLGAGSLSGLVIDSSQLLGLAPSFAAALGVIVAD
ncbi:pentapeptide repeat-containing protein [Saccharomonospora cyanea]|nr:pentapeptide repeat-containing protein [Saccharomonospora cyanea]